METSEKIFEAAHKEIQKFQKYQSAAEIPDQEIPDNFDLRNISGVNYAGKVRDQGDCGSCYANAFIQVIENRLRMKYGLFVVPDLSVQQLVSCNYMTEGCKGGWGVMNGFFAENVPLVTEKCAPYVGQEAQCKPFQLNDQCKEVARVSRTYNVPSNEKSIQKEILKNGMVDIGWAFPMAAMNMKKGILKNIPGFPYKNDPNYDGTVAHSNEFTLKQEDKIDSLTHATTLIGWGVSPKDQTKYWIVRNSYGPNWGDEGDFKVLRGKNAFYIENFAGGYDVELISY